MALHIPPTRPPSGCSRRPPRRKKNDEQGRPFLQQLERNVALFIFIFFREGTGNLARRRLLLAFNERRICEPAYRLLGRRRPSAAVGRSMSHRLATFLFPNDVDQPMQNTEISQNDLRLFSWAPVTGGGGGRGVRNVRRLSAGHHVNEASRLSRVDLFPVWLAVRRVYLALVPVRW